MKKILLLFLFVGLFYSTGMEFQRLSGTPIINAQVDVRETCFEYELDHLTFCTGYYHNKMYFYFYIKDYTYSATDSFRLFFDLNNNNQNDGDEPLILIQRNGSVSGYSYDGMEYYVISEKVGKAIPWKGELTIPFEVLGLSRELNEKTIYGPNISLSVYDSSQGILDKFESPPGALWTQTYSNTYWSDPKSISISNEILEDVVMFPLYSNVVMMKIKIITNEEEPYKITNLKIQANNTNANEEIDIKEVNLYSIISENKQLISTQIYNGDNGFVSFNIDETITGDYTESNPYYFLIEYVISDKLQIDSPAPGVYFNFSLISLSAKGIYTDKNLTVNGLPLSSILLTAHQCGIDNDCKNNEYCKNKWCSLVEQKSECGYVSNHKWINYECCKNEDCVEGNCIDNVCVIELPVDEPIVEPPVDEPVVEPPVDEPVVEPPINDTENSTDNEPEIPPIDLNETNEENKKEECISKECTNFVWEKCDCYENNIGVKKGTCIDNCNKTIFNYVDCTCESKTITEDNEVIVNEESPSLISIIIAGAVVVLILGFILKTYLIK